MDGSLEERKRWPAILSEQLTLVLSGSSFGQTTMFDSQLCHVTMQLPT